MPHMIDITAPYMPAFSPYKFGTRIFMKKMPNWMELFKESLPTIEEFTRNYRQEKIKMILSKEN